jgi:hypothetical protein
MLSAMDFSAIIDGAWIAVAIVAAFVVITWLSIKLGKKPDA